MTPQELIKKWHNEGPKTFDLAEKIVGALASVLQERDILQAHYDQMTKELQTLRPKRAELEKAIKDFSARWCSKENCGETYPECKNEACEMFTLQEAVK